MDDEQKMLIGIGQEVAGIKTAFAESQKDTCRRLDAIEASLRSLAKERFAYAAAVVTTAVNIVNCIGRFLPAGGAR